MEKSSENFKITHVLFPSQNYFPCFPAGHSIRLFIHPFINFNKYISHTSYSIYILLTQSLMYLIFCLSMLYMPQITWPCLSSHTQARETHLNAAFFTT